MGRKDKKAKRQKIRTVKLTPVQRAIVLAVYGRKWSGSADLNTLWKWVKLTDAIDTPDADMVEQYTDAAKSPEEYDAFCEQPAEEFEIPGSVFDHVADTWKDFKNFTLAVDAKDILAIATQLGVMPEDPDELAEGEAETKTIKAAAKTAKKEDEAA